MSIGYTDWEIFEDAFDPSTLNHAETIFTQGNGYLGTRGTFEEKYPDENRYTFIHGIFDDVPLFSTELANAPDWTNLTIFLAGERFSFAQGEILNWRRSLNLKNGLLTRSLRWKSPGGKITELIFERFASMAIPHLTAQRIVVTPINYQGEVILQTGLDSSVDNLGYKHWLWENQAVKDNTVMLHVRTKATKIDLITGISLVSEDPQEDCTTTPLPVDGCPAIYKKHSFNLGEKSVFLKWTHYFFSRESETPWDDCHCALSADEHRSWEEEFASHSRAWERLWEHSDIVIEGDLEAQIAARFSIYSLLIAGSRSDENVSIGAKTLSGHGYRGHAFWDTEIFMLPFFTYTQPEIARNLLSYRWHRLQAARENARRNGYLGAQYPWESAATGQEVTPAWLPDPQDLTKLIRIWPGDLEVHISADIAYAVMQYVDVSGDIHFLLERGAEIVLETARFWASRVEWDETASRYNISNVIGPDEYHEHVDNNQYTNHLCRWNLQTAIDLTRLLIQDHPSEWNAMSGKLSLQSNEVEQWQHIVENIDLSFDAKTELIEQFEGYFKLRDVPLASLEPRTKSIQQLFGNEGANETQLIKQPDVVMLLYLLPEPFSRSAIKANYDYYTPRTDVSHGSSLGPAIQSIMASRTGDERAYSFFTQAARADLFDVRGNASDGIHGASAGGVWQAVVFGFGGLRRLHGSGKWTAVPRLPKHWTRLKFKIMDRGELVTFDLVPEANR
ncbi:MAG TPA: glycoside hydrolase family 65 protein [Bellilinea sp.]|nr:glycoside hydrolase family 65 protein [Bellilinea sp.]